ncbi:MAG TPA: ArsR family transcriptional regulator [Candidatus Limnocylindrales bacterium]|nr:ArsR family transcriptional regulator [Candidatus Limnocylindrales bacterium]
MPGPASSPVATRPNAASSDPSPAEGPTGTPGSTALPGDASSGIPTRPTAEAGSASSLRRQLLFELRRGGPASPDQLALALGASRTGVLQQLRALESANLVVRRTVRHGVGRPRHVYDITPDAQDLFPANYDALAVNLLEALRAVGGDALIEEVFLARRRQQAALIRARFAERLGPNADLAARVRELAVIQDEQGYLCSAALGEDGTVRLVEHNCAIYHVARRYPAACRAELELFRDVLGGEVVRERHIGSGDRCCAYRISPGSVDPAPS